MAKCVMDNLNEEQQYAVNFSGKHLLVLAGAGTGKTHTIISRARKLIEEDGVAPKRIVILSFTRKSAQEIAERIKAGLPTNSIRGLAGRTFHSWCNELIVHHKNAFIGQDFTMMDEEDRVSCFQLICGRNFKDTDGERIKPSKISDVCSYMANKMCSLSEAIRVKLYDNINLEILEDDDEDMRHYKEGLIEKISKIKPIFAEVIRKYIAFKQERKYLDYDDLLMIVSKTMKSNKELRSLITSDYDHILIDEMQDTNPLQYELLSSFYDKCHLFCVGDDAQSIYGFRGADFKTIHNFTNVVPESQSCKLTINYRSTQEILDLSDWMLGQSKLQYNKKLKAHRGSGKKPLFIHYDSDWQEANDIINKIKNSVTVENLKYRDNLVLSRSLFGLRTVEACCVENKIPYVIFGGSGLMKSKHVRDVASAMRIIANYKDELAWTRYLKLWDGIGDVTAAKIINSVIFKDSLDDSLMALMELDVEKSISDTLINISNCKNNTVGAINGALKGMSKMLQATYKDEWNAWRKNDFTLLSKVAENTGGISEFITEYVLDPKMETTFKDVGKNADYVILSTIHQAKGLEAKNCYILNVSPFSFPNPRSILNGEDCVEEERRCLYVAMTRAKDGLFLYRNIITAHVQTGSQEDANINDRYFLNGISENLVEYVNISKQQHVSMQYQQEPPQVDLESFYNFE